MKGMKDAKVMKILGLRAFEPFLIRRHQRSQT